MAINKSVFGIYRSRSEVGSAVNALRDASFARSHISVLLPENLGSNELVAEKETKAPNLATISAGSGAAIGGALGWLVGMGALVIPGIGPVVAAGPIVGTLAGLGVGGALGGFVGALVGVGIPEHEATRYEGRLSRGGILVAVHCGSAEEIERAKMIMATNGAEDIASVDESCADANAA
jgi:hypothetical protein